SDQQRTDADRWRWPVAGEREQMTDQGTSTGSDIVRGTPLRYLDKAMSGLRSLGLVPESTTTQEAPIVALLDESSDLDHDRIVAITRTLAQASLFNDVVREQVEAMEVGNRY